MPPDNAFGLSKERIVMLCFWLVRAATNNNRNPNHAIEEDEMLHNEQKYIDEAAEDRRKFLASCGKFAVVTPPAITLLLSTSLHSMAVAQSAGNNGNHGNGNNGNGNGNNGNGNGGNGNGRGNNGNNGPS
jgi:hypothetical protein